MGNSNNRKPLYVSHLTFIFVNMLCIMDRWPEVQINFVLYIYNCHAHVECYLLYVQYFCAEDVRLYGNRTVRYANIKKYCPYFHDRRHFYTFERNAFVTQNLTSCQ